MLTCCPSPSTTRDRLVPAALAEIHPQFSTPYKAQILCGLIAGVLATFFDVKLLSEILDIGVLMGYGTVCGCVLVLRSEDRSRCGGSLVALVLATAIPCIALKYDAGVVAVSVLLLFPLAVLGYTLLLGPSYINLPSQQAFSCPLVPHIPLLGVILNVYLLCDLGVYAWIRFLVLFLVLIGYYVWRGGELHLQEPPTTFTPSLLPQSEEQGALGHDSSTMNTPLLAGEGNGNRI